MYTEKKINCRIAKFKPRGVYMCRKFFKTNNVKLKEGEKVHFYDRKVCIKHSGEREMKSNKIIHPHMYAM